MLWRRTDPVQQVGALLAVGPAVDRLAAAMARKSVLFQGLSAAHGAGWAVLFAAPLDGDGDGEPDPVLPRLPEATPLWSIEPGWWLPVGMTLDVPDHARPALLQAACRRDGFEPPAVLAPRSPSDADPAEVADVYLVGDCRPFRDTVLALPPMRRP